MNLLITGAWKNARKYLKQIEQMGNTVRFLQYENEELPCNYDWVEGVICNGLFVHHPIEKFSKLKYIQLTSAGYDRVLVEYVRKQGIRINNAKGVYSTPMAEWVVMSVLLIYKNMREFFRKQQHRNWEKDRTLLELTDKKVCIVGYGSVGQEVAKRLAAFDTEITVVNRSEVDDVLVHRWVPLEQIDEALPEADIVILCIALTQDTKGLFDNDRLTKMKEESALVNVSRGAVINEKALVQHLKEGKFRGVALDVFEEEPLSENSDLWDNPRVIITPHNSFVGDKVEERMVQVIDDNLQSVKV